MTKINQVLQKSIQKMQQLEDEMEKIINLFAEKQESKGFQELVLLIEENPGNLYVVKKALEILQFVHDEAVFSQYSLEDIEKYYKELLAIHPTDYDVAFECAYFMSCVQADEQEAFRIVDNLQRGFEHEKSEFLSFHQFGS